MNAYKVEDIQFSIAALEKENALIVKTLIEADSLLRRIGFENGLETVKHAAKEIIRSGLRAK